MTRSSSRRTDTLAGADWSTPNKFFVNPPIPQSEPVALAVDVSGNVYVADSGLGVIRKVSPDGSASVLTNANAPQGVAVDAAGNLYVSDSGNHTIRKITVSGQDSVLAGARGLSGAVDGNGAVARFNNPGALSVDGSGNVFVADTDNHLLRMISAAGQVTTVAGRAGSIGVLLGDLPGSLSRPVGIAIDSEGALYTTSENSVLRILLH